MNGMLAVGADPNITDAGGIMGGSLPVAVFALVGMILLFAALRLVRREPSSKPRRH